MEYQQHQQHCSQSVLTAQQEALEVASPSTPPAQCGSIPRRRASPSVPGTLPGSLETSLLYALQVRAAQRVLQCTHCIVPVPLSSAAACMEGEATRGRPCPSSCLHGLGHLTCFFAPVSCLDTQNRLPACLLTSWLPPSHPLHARTSSPPTHPLAGMAAAPGAPAAAGQDQRRRAAGRAGSDARVCSSATRPRALPQRRPPPPLVVPSSW